MLDEKFVTELFGHLKNKPDAFFKHVADDVKWVVMGTHPLAGSYYTKKDFLEHTFGRLAKVLKGGALLEVENITVSGDCAVVEMRSISTANNGKPFNNTYCWVTEFTDNVITSVRAYVDSALVQRVIAENEESPEL